MSLVPSQFDAASAPAQANRAAMLALIEQLRSLEARAVARSAQAQARFEKRGQLLPRDRLALLLDPGSPFLELASMSGYGQDLAHEKVDPATSVPGSGAICGIGYVAGVRTMVVCDDSGIDAGALQPQKLEKFQRMQAIALREKLPLIHMVESAGANLLKYRVEHFIHGGSGFYWLARLSAAGIPVIALVHGSSTAGGAYMPGLSDHVVMVRKRAKAFLAGPPLLKAATGEIATDEELGGAEMHAMQSGLAEHIAEDDADAVRIGRDIVANLGWNDHHAPLPQRPYLPPAYPADDLLGLMPADWRQPIDMQEIIARLVDGSDFSPFKADYGPATVCGHAAIMGKRVGIITNNGPLDVAGATKATHFIQSCCQTGLPIIYLQNTTGFIVGKDSERSGMIKHGSKMIQAVSNANVPQITIMCGASFGAGNYGMCGRGFGPRFVFSWPNAKTSVMGAEQAATTMAIVAEEKARAKGASVPEAMLSAMKAEITARFEPQSTAFHTSGLLLDDGIIDPRDTRAVLGIVLDVCLDAERRQLRPIQFAVARP